MMNKDPVEDPSISEQETMPTTTLSQDALRQITPELDHQRSTTTLTRTLSNTKRAEQNRKAQRAFRERRDMHMKHLESRSAMLEDAVQQAEISNNRWAVAQATAKRLQDDKEILLKAMDELRSLNDARVNKIINDALGRVSVKPATSSMQREGPDVQVVSNGPGGPGNVNILTTSNHVHSSEDTLRHLATDKTMSTTIPTLPTPPPVSRQKKRPRSDSLTVEEVSSSPPGISLPGKGSLNAIVTGGGGSGAGNTPQIKRRKEPIPILPAPPLAPAVAPPRHLAKPRSSYSTTDYRGGAGNGNNGGSVGKNNGGVGGNGTPASTSIASTS